MTPSRKGQINHGPNGDDVKRLRKMRGWSQSAAAKALGVSLSTVKRWETDGVIDKERDRETVQAELARPAKLGRVHLTPKRDVNRIVNEVRRLVTAFNIERANEAKFGKLLAIRKEIVAAVKSALVDAGGNDPHFSQIVEDMVDLLTSDSEPPVEARDFPSPAENPDVKKIDGLRGR